MSAYTLLFLRTISKTKKSPDLLRTYPAISCPSPSVSQDKEACHAL